MLLLGTMLLEKWLYDRQILCLMFQVHVTTKRPADIPELDSHLRHSTELTLNLVAHHIQDC